MNHHEQSDKSKKSSEQRARTKKTNKKQKTQIKKRTYDFFSTKKNQICEIILKNKLKSHGNDFGTKN